MKDNQLEMPQLASSTVQSPLVGYEYCHRDETLLQIQHVSSPPVTECICVTVLNAQ